MVVAKTRMNTEYCITKQGRNTKPPQTIDETINNESTLERRAAGPTV